MEELTDRCIDDEISDVLLAALPSEAASARLIDIRVGPFWCVVQTTLGAGMASTLARESSPHDGFPIAAAGHLHEHSPLELAGLVHSSSVAEAAVGLAAVNSMLPRPFQNVSEDNAHAIIADRGPRAKVAVVGRFPFAAALGDRVEELWVFERDAVRVDGEFGAEDMERLLPRADVVAITATTIINHSLGAILDLVPEDTFALMLGPSTPFLPAFFDRGFDALCGSVIVDPEAVLRDASQGAVTRQIGAVRRIAVWSGDEVRSGFGLE